MFLARLVSLVTLVPCSPSLRRRGFWGRAHTFPACVGAMPAATARTAEVLIAGRAGLCIKTGAFVETVAKAVLLVGLLLLLMLVLLAPRRWRWSADPLLPRLLMCDLLNWTACQSRDDLLRTMGGAEGVQEIALPPVVTLERGLAICALRKDIVSRSCRLVPLGTAVHVLKHAAEVLEPHVDVRESDVPPCLGVKLAEVSNALRVGVQRRRRGRLQHDQARSINPPRHQPLSVVRRAWHHAGEDIVSDL
jgi:hypothetical protein